MRNTPQQDKPERPGVILSITVSARTLRDGANYIKKLPRASSVLRSMAVLFLQRLVTLARHRLQGIQIKDLDDAARVADGAGGLYFARHLGDRGAPNAEHFREEFLSEIDGLALGAVAGLKQPTAEPRLDVVQRIAG